LEKKVLVTQLTHFSVVNRSPERRLWNPETRTFFGREILFAEKFLARKLEIVKIFGMKSEKSKKNPGESLYVRIFPTGNENCRKIFGSDWCWMGKVPAGYFVSPPLRHPCPRWGRGRMR